MNAVWTLFLSNLRAKKLQNGLTMVLILLSTLLLSTAMIVILNTQNLFIDMHTKANGSHQILMLENGLHDPESFRRWWDEQPGVTASELMPYRSLSGISHHGKEINNIYMFMMDTLQLPSTVDNLIWAQGDRRSAPESGTIWIPTSLAYSNGIVVGDKISFKTGKSTFELKVDAVVVDIPFGAPFSRNARIWMNSQDYKEKFQLLQGNDKYMMGLRFDDYDTNILYWNHFEQQSGTPYPESKIEFESISSFYLIINKVIGFVMIFLGAVMLLVALFTIGFTISDAILANYRTIGVLKSCGLSSFGIIGTYLLQYTFLAIIGMVPGLAASRFLSKVIVESSLSSLKTDRTELLMQGNITLLNVGITVLALVILCVLLYANKARSVQPVQAIRYGMSELDISKGARRLGSSGSRLTGFDHFPVTMVIGLRNLLKNVKGSILMLMLTLITSAVLVFGFVLLYSIHSIQQTASAWGYDNSHVAVEVFNKAAFSRARFEEGLLSDSRIKNFGWSRSVTGVIPSEKSEDKEHSETQSMNVYINVTDGSYNDLGYSTLSGANPSHGNEIAIGMNVSRKLQKNIGDWITVYVNGKKYSLLVTGIYQAISNMSYSARITEDVLKLDPFDLNDAEVCLINLNDSSQADQVVRDINENYQESLSAVTQKTLLDSVFKEAVSILVLPMSMMGLLFVVVTCIIIYIICRISIRKENKTYGIYKSIGLTSGRIRLSIAQGIVALSVIGAILGICVGVYVLPILLENILSSYGIMELPLIMHWGGIIGVAFASIVSAGTGSWLSSRVIAKTSPRILVVE